MRKESELAVSFLLTQFAVLMSTLGSYRFQTHWEQWGQLFRNATNQTSIKHETHINSTNT